MATRLFTIGDFRFSVASAIGKWSRLATMGVKEKDGSRMEFNAETLGSMVDNFAARGDKLAICQDHLSAYVSQTGRPAPALGYFTSLAVVEGGKVVKFATAATDAPPDPSGLDDGLYACLGEVTPLGADPLQGFAAFAFLSPMFSESAKDETGADIGMALYDAAVTNTPFQSGCSIQFHGLSATAAPRATAMAQVQISASGGTVTVAVLRMQIDPIRVRRIIESAGAVVIGESDNGPYMYVFKTSGKTTAELESALKRAGIQPDMFSATPATPVAPRRLSKGSKMDDTEMAKRFGFEPDDDDAKKAERMAKYFSDVDAMKAKMDAATSAAGSAITASTMASDHSEPDGDEAKAMAALSASLVARGVKVPEKASRAVLMSLATLSPALPDTAALKAEIKRELAAEAAAAAEKAERETMVTMARTAKAPDYEIAALGVLPLVNARQMAAKYAGNANGAPAHLFSMASSQGGPIGGPGAGQARNMSVAPAAEHVRTAKNGDTIVEKDGEIARIAREMRDSKDPVVMSRLDAFAMDKHGNTSALARMLSAQALAESDHPHLMTRAG